MNNLDSLNFRLLEKEDYNRGYLDLLKQLTVIGNISNEKFNDILDKIKTEIWIIEDNNKIIASASLFLEQNIDFYQINPLHSYLLFFLVLSSFSNDFIGFFNFPFISFS